MGMLADTFTSLVLALYVPILGKFGIAFTANDKREIRFYKKKKKMSTSIKIEQNNSCLDASATLLNFTVKLKSTSGKCRINMVTWSFLPFAVCCRDFSIVLCCTSPTCISSL